MASLRPLFHVLAALCVALSATTGFAQSTVTLNATSGTGTISTNYSTTGGLTFDLGFYAEYLILAGGGGGAGANNNGNAFGGGGGGAGGLLTGTTRLYSTTYHVVVGGGGAGGQMTATTALQQGSNGANSVFGSFTATGGGGGGRFQVAGNSGGSGGGGGGRGTGSGLRTAGGAGTAGQGFAGGASRDDNATGRSAGGGGGGAGAVGGTGGTNVTTAGNGGAGLASTITGASVTYAGGGGGGAWDTNDSSEVRGTGGAGGGGDGSLSGNAVAGTDGLGGGGGGVGTGGAGGSGGAGQVIIRYQGAALGDASTPGAFVTSGTGSAAGYTLYTYATSGTTSVGGDLILNAVDMNTRLATTLTGTLTGSGGLTFAGPGTLTLASPNTYSGATVVSGGTLVVGAGGSIANSGTTVVVGGNLGGAAGANGLSGTLAIDGGSVSARNVYIAHSLTAPRTATGVLNVASGTLSVAGNMGVGTEPINASSWYSAGNGSLNVLGGGVVDVRGVLISGTGSAVNVGSGGVLKAGGEYFNLTGPTNINDGTIHFDGTSSQWFSGTVTGSGAMVKSGGLLVVNGSMNSTGGVTISSGTVRVTSSGAIAGDVANSGVLEFATYTRANRTFAGSISGTGQLLSSVNSSGLTLTGSNTFTGLTTVANSGTLSIGNGGTAGSLAGGIALNGSSLVFNRSDTSTYGGNIAGSGSLTKLGAGALTLSGSNSFKGDTTVSSGTLVLGGGQALSSTAAVTVASGATLQATTPIRIGYIDSQGTVVGGENLSATLTVTRSGNIGGIANGTDSQGTFAAGIVKLGSGTSTVNSPNSYTGLTWVREGTLAAGTASAFAAASDLTVDSGATFDRAGYSQTVADASVYGTLGNTGGGGLLTVTGILNGTGSIVGNVLTTGRFQGSQSITGDVEVQGVHAPGNSAGIQSISGNLSYTSGGSGPSVAWELFDNTDSNVGTTSFDQILVSGDLSFATATSFVLAFDGLGSLVDWSDTFWDTNEQWVVWSVTGSTTGIGSLSLTGTDWTDSIGQSLGTLRAGSFFSLGLGANGKDVVLSYVATSVPEIDPAGMGSVLALVTGVLGLLERRRLKVPVKVPVA